MQYDDAAVIKSGIPKAHATVFQQVANECDTIIISRSVGKYATQLIEESYATKGFHVKTKSCNWGPMAGFVLADPRFSKNGADRNAQDSQYKSTMSAIINHGATLKGLYITENRRSALPLLFHGDATTSYSETYVCNDERLITARKNDTILEFVLKRQYNVPGAGSIPLWAVCYRDNKKLPAKRFLGAVVETTNFGVLNQVMGLTDPRGHKPTMATYRGVMTGDYDLWGCFPKVSVYDPEGLDARMVPNSNSQLFNYKMFNRFEDKHRGNITQRIQTIRLSLNNKFKQTGYRGGDLVHHSDEAGRPMVDNIEYDAIAFIPNEPIMYFENRLDYDAFISRSRKLGYQTILNAWWHLISAVGEERFRSDILGARKGHVNALGLIKERAHPLLQRNRAV